MTSGGPPRRRRFGQHFLEPAWVLRLVTLIDPQATDRFIEIGAGRGALTDALAPHIRRLVAIEIDRDLGAALAARAPANVEVIAQDVLALDLRELCATRLPGGTPVRIAGNLPYYVSSPILGYLTEFARQHAPLLDATLMLQREVVDRLVASPGTKSYGALTVLVRLHADATRLADVPRRAFRPVPGVESAIVRLRFHPPTVEIAAPRTFETMVRTLFSQRRKMLRNALRPIAAARGLEPEAVLGALGVDPRRRAETLDLAEFATIATVLEPRKAPAVL